MSTMLYAARAFPVGESPENVQEGWGVTIEVAMDVVHRAAGFDAVTQVTEFEWEGEVDFEGGEVGDAIFEKAVEALVQAFGEPTDQPDPIPVRIIVP